MFSSGKTTPEVYERVPTAQKTTSSTTIEIRRRNKYRFDSQVHKKSERNSDNFIRPEVLNIFQEIQRAGTTYDSVE